MPARAIWLPSIAILMAILPIACGESAPQGIEHDSPKAQSDPDAPINPLDFFPHKVGTQWVYRLTPGSFPPEIHWDIFWRGTDGKTYRQWADESGGNEGKLILKVKAEGLPPNSELAVRNYTSGVEIEVVEDSPRHYEHMAAQDAILAGKYPIINPRVYWAVAEKPFTIDEVMIFDSSYAPPQAVPGNDGRQTRTLMITPGFTGSSQVLGADVWLSGKETDLKVPGYEGQPCLHFIRKFGDSEAPTATEDLWYARGKGLVRVVKKRGDETTLTLDLVEFTP